MRFINGFLMYSVGLLLFVFIKLVLNVDITSFYVTFIPITFFIFSIVASKAFFKTIVDENTELKLIHYLFTIFSMILIYGLCEYIVYLNTFIDKSLYLNYVQQGNLLKETVNYQTGMPYTYFDYLTSFMTELSLFGILSGNGFTLSGSEVPVMLYHIIDLVSMCVGSWIAYISVRPKELYCKDCGSYMKSTLGFSFDHGDGTEIDTLERLDELVACDSSYDILIDVMRDNKDLKNQTNMFVNGDFHYCDSCSNMKLVLTKYEPSGSSRKDKEDVLNVYDLDNTARGLFLRQ